MTGPVLHVSIPGLCPPAPRPRARVMGKGKQSFAQVYTPQSGPYAQWKKHAANWVAYALDIVGRQGSAWQKGADPLEVRLLFVVPLPQSSHRKTIHVPRDWCQSHARGDADNLAKGPLDASNDLVWIDDRDVVRLYVEKITGEQGEAARTELMVRRLSREDAHRTDFERVREALRESGELIGPELRGYEPCQQQNLSGLA